MEEMTCYIGTKLILGREMNLGEYNLHRGWTIPEDEDPEKEGYLVSYPDDYISWSPKDVFEESYRPTSEGTMSFSGALAMLKGGIKVARIGWNGKGMFLFMVDGSQFAVNRAPLNEIYPEGTVIDYRPHIDMKTADGQIVPWVASQSDLLVDDWTTVE